jgi:hypothetical protein
MLFTDSENTSGFLSELLFYGFYALFQFIGILKVQVSGIEYYIELLALFFF